jgi:hypothetical protein
MKDMFLGETMEFWCRLRAAMRKANINTVQELEAKLGVLSQGFSVHGMQSQGSLNWAVVQGNEVLCWCGTRDRAERIALDLAKANE